MWMIYIMSGILSAPFHFFILASFYMLELRPRKERGSGEALPPRRMFWLSVACVLYLTVDVLPSAALFTDLTCGCDTEDCMGDTPACRISKYSIFVLMMIFYSLLTQVVRLAIRLDEKCKSIRKVPGVELYAKFADIINSVIVVNCLIASIVLDTDEGPESNSQYWVNTMRDAFTCNPRFSELYLEVIFVHFHFIFCGIAMVSSVACIIYDMAEATKSIAPVSRPKESNGSPCKALPRNLSAAQQANTVSKRIKNVQHRIMGLGFACAILLVFNVVSKVINIEKYDEIARRADIFAECQPYGAVCDPHHDLGKEVRRILEECASAESESKVGNGDPYCTSSKCFDSCGDLGEVCNVNFISGLFECVSETEANAWRPLVDIHAKCCGDVDQPDYLTKARPTAIVVGLSHLSLTLVPLMIGVMFSQTDSLRKAWVPLPPDSESGCANKSEFVIQSSLPQNESSLSSNVAE